MRINFPYLPEGRKINFIPSNSFLEEAKKISEQFGCIKQPTGAVVVKDGQVIGRGSNAGKKVSVCPRWSSPTGKNYEPCRPICRQDGHAEVMAVRDAQEEGFDTANADLYLYGHWWCCKNCWDTMIAAGIKNVYLLEGASELFNPEFNHDMKNWGRPKN